MARGDCSQRPILPADGQVIRAAAQQQLQLVGTQHSQDALPPPPPSLQGPLDSVDTDDLSPLSTLDDRLQAFNTPSPKLRIIAEWFAEYDAQQEMSRHYVTSFDVMWLTKTPIR